MLATSLGGFRLPGPTRIMERYSAFQIELPALCHEMGLVPGELQFVELRTLIASWIADHPVGG
jgi:hypothetical protein